MSPRSSISPCSPSASGAPSGATTRASNPSGFPGDPGVGGNVTGKIKGDVLLLSFKAPGRKVLFSGTRSGFTFTGLLKVAVPPEKSEFSDFVLPDFTALAGGSVQAPELDPPPSPTASTALALTGRAPPGAEIRISGGGRCNFTNIGATAANFLSANPHFAKSALGRFTPADFLSLVEKHGIAWH